MRIQNNIMAMNTHRMYTINNSNIQKSAEKLSSGYRINRAGDDAAGLAISEKMRSQIRGLGMASKNSQDAISLVQTAEGALQEVHSMLQRMNELAVQSATGTNQTFDRLQLAKEFDQLKREINDIAEQTTFNNMKILDGSLSSEGPERSAQTAGLLVSNSVPSSEIEAGTAVKGDKNEAIAAGGIVATPYDDGSTPSPNTAVAAGDVTPTPSSAGSAAEGPTISINISGVTGGAADTEISHIKIGGVDFEITNGSGTGAPLTLDEGSFTLAEKITEGGTIKLEADGKVYTGTLTGNNLVVTADGATNNGAIDLFDPAGANGVTVSNGTAAASDTVTVNGTLVDGKDEVLPTNAETAVEPTGTYKTGDKLTITVGNDSFDVTIDADDIKGDALATLINTAATNAGVSNFTATGIAGDSNVTLTSTTLDGSIGVSYTGTPVASGTPSDAETTITPAADFIAGDKLTIKSGNTTLTLTATEDNLADFNSLTGLTDLINAAAVEAGIDGTFKAEVDGTDVKLTDSSLTTHGDKITATYTGATKPEEPADPADPDAEVTDVTSYLEIDRNKMRDGDKVTLTINGEAHEATWNGSVEDFISELGIDGAELKTNTLVIKNAELTQDDLVFEAADKDLLAYGTMRIQVGALEFEQLNIEVKSMNTAGLKLDGFNLEDQDSAGAAITATRAAVNVVSEQRALLGAMQNRLEHKISNLDNTAENLQAAESRIRDVDIAKEMTTFTKNNILAQAATAMLAQANAAPQSVLSLLQ